MIGLREDRAGDGRDGLVGAVGHGRELDEQAFRFGRRLNDAQRFVAAIAGSVGTRLTSAELIAADAGAV